MGSWLEARLAEDLGGRLATAGITLGMGGMVLPFRQWEMALAEAVDMDMRRE